MRLRFEHGTSLTGRGSMMENDIRWICVHTRPRMEGRVSEGLQGLCLDVFNPVVPADERSKPKIRNKKHKAYAPLYPGYTFCRVRLGETDLRRLKDVYGVRRVVQFGDKPNRVPDEDIEGLRNDPVRVKHAYERGDRVRMVKEGWSGYEGIIVTVKRERSGRERARLLLDHLLHPIWVNAQDFEPAA